MANLKILSLNVNNFGGKEVKKESKIWSYKEEREEREERAERIAAWIKNENAEIVVLQEFEVGEIGDKLINLISEKYNVHYGKHKGFSVVLIAFRTDINFRKTFISKELKAFLLWNEVDIHLTSGQKLKVIGIHVPPKIGEKREEFKRALANINHQIPTVVIGDFNAATNDDRAKINDHKENEKFLQMLNNNFIDAWRKENPLPIKEYTWYYKQDESDGRRLDYAFISESLELALVKHDPGVNMTLCNSGLSDHSALIVELKGIL